MCILEGCKLRPYFNIEGDKKALYCCKHKNEGMIYVKHKLCINDGCNKQSVFNMDGETLSLIHI